MDNFQNTSSEQKHIYPSMQEGFIPLDFSSPVQSNQSNHRNYQQTPYYNNRQNQQYRNNYFNNRNNYFQQNNFRTNDERDDFSLRNNSGNRFHQQPNRNKFRDSRGGMGSSGQSYNKGNLDISNYAHPSMLDDPWKEVVERYNAMNVFAAKDDKKVENSCSDEESSNEE